MRLLPTLALYFLASPALSLPSQHDLAIRSSGDIALAQPIAYFTNWLEKRRGGGGGGGGGGRAGGGSSGGSSSSGSSSGGSSSGGGSRAPAAGGAAGGAAAGSRNTGTASSSSAVGPGSRGFYGGGSTSAYQAGRRSPLGGILPFALLGGAIGAAAIFPGLWLFGAYEYNYNHPYSFHNVSNTTNNGQNDTLPVTCLCQMYNACGCDDNGNSTFLDSVVGNGSYDGLNKTQVNVANVNGTRTLVLNGTLPNGTDTSAAASSSATTSGATGGMMDVASVQWWGMWLLISGVAMVMTLK